MKFSLECECAGNNFNRGIFDLPCKCGSFSASGSFWRRTQVARSTPTNRTFALVTTADPKTQSLSFDVLWQSDWENSSTHGFIPLARGAKLFVSKGARDEVRRLTIFLGPASLPFFKGGGIRLLHRCFGSIWPIQDAFQGKYSLYGSDKNIPRSPCTAFPLL